ncbi:UDP-glucosyl transferase 78D2 [Actinidia rufa]|uniref:UDP-glucosyl transferase 78D2 n=1 Tax=Actinidia rufa TaxID=165716 RepID=A0A7J0DKU4_9ERIC|nr:UDP-glucosyl transferase 78D2 [Actinidia rufa]
MNDLPEGVLHGDLESPFAQMLHKMGLNLPRATAVVLNSFEELEPATNTDLKLRLQKVLHVGPPSLSSSPTSSLDESGCLLWLDKHEAASVAYISFGTIITPPPNELLALAEALRASKIPFLWSLRDHSRPIFPEGFLENVLAFGKVVSWAPQSQVLAHPSIGVFVTHCGWNSILESITGGVPMICRPFFGDQTLNSRMVQDAWGIGVRVDGGVFTKSSMMSAVELIFSREEGKKLRENIILLKQKATEAVGASGSSTENFNVLLEVIKTCKHPKS